MLILYCKKHWQIDRFNVDTFDASFFPSDLKSSYTLLASSLPYIISHCSERHLRKIQITYATMDAQTLNSSSGCNRFAGRVPAGLEVPVVLKKNGVRHVRPISLSKVALSVLFMFSNILSLLATPLLYTSLR
jgi:hypothetical protein